MRLCFARLRLIRYHSYDDPIRNPSITAGPQFFDVQKATDCCRKTAICGQRFLRDGWRNRRPGGSDLPRSRSQWSIKPLRPSFFVIIV